MQWHAIDAETASFLLSAQAEEMIASLAGQQLAPNYLLQTLTALRRRASAQQAGAVVALAQLRQRAAGKFPRAERLYFVPEALEQATAWPVAMHRAAWLHNRLPPGPVLDLGCGIGGDMLALAQFRQVLAYEIDPVRARFAEANAAAMDVASRVEIHCANWVEELAADRLPVAAGAFADPSRRRAGARIFSLHDMEPPLEQLLALQQQIPALGVKVMPGVDENELPTGCGVEFTGHDGACKEAVLWFGSLAAHRRWATVQAGNVWHEVVGDAGQTLPIGPVQDGDFIHEPHPAVIRAGAFAELCAQLDAHLIEAQIAYMASPRLRTYPLVQSFRVLEVHPFSLKLLNQRIQALAIGQLELKKRGFPVAPEQLRPRLKMTKSGRSATLLILRRDAGHEMIFAERINDKLRN
jgi:SAM-dependent methyltransferase